MQCDTANNERVMWLDSLRGFACLSVYFAHDLKTFHNIDSFLGKTGVDILFILCAWLTCDGLSKAWDMKRKPYYREVCLFYIKRFFRIMPLYLLSLLPYAFIMKLTFRGFWEHFFLIKVTGHFWTIPAEMLFYVIAPILVSIFKILNTKYNILLMIGTCLSIWCLSFVLCYISSGDVIYWFPLFFLGGMIPEIVSIPRKRKKLGGGNLDIGILCLIVSIEMFGLLYNQWNKFEPANKYMQMLMGFHEYVYSYVLLSILVTMLLISFSKNSDSKLRKKIEKISFLQIAGKISYPFYLFHYPIIFAVRKMDVFCNYSGNRWLQTLFSISLTFGISFMIHSMVEEPISRFIKKYLG